MLVPRTLPLLPAPRHSCSAARCFPLPPHRQDTLVKVYCTEPAPPIGPPIPNTTTTTTSSTTTTTTTSTTTTTPPTTPNTTNTTTTTPHMEEYYANPVPVKELPYWDEEPRGSVGEPIGSADILPYGHVCGIDG